MKNAFALTQKNELIHIGEVDKKTNNKYFCCNCGDELIARKGNVKIHHFSHKHQIDCNYESYLHKLSKLKFYNIYKNCLDNHIPFYLEFLTDQNCISCLDLRFKAITCNFKRSKNIFELTRRFDLISIEKKRNNYVADILLESSKYGDAIFIEFAVKHKCEKEKIDSKERIIEILIECEEDLLFLDRRIFELYNKKILYHNFAIQNKDGNYYKRDECKMLFDTFIVYNSGKAILRNMPMYEIIQNLNEKEFQQFKILDKYEMTDDYGEDFIKLVRQASFCNLKIMNCFACKFFAKNNRYFSENIIFCKKHKMEIENSNYAANCKNFWRIEK